MKAASTIRKRQSEAGIALLIAIFILLLISVIAIALIVSAGTESALAGNYRNATAVYYAALAGLEEGRGRLAVKNSNSFSTTAPGFLPPPGTPLAVGSPIYIINPVGGEIVAPWDPASLYPDTQFNPEFGSSGFLLPNPSPSTASLSTVAGVQGPLYKWVRINAVSEKSLNLDVAPIDSVKDPTTPVFYDGTRLNISNSGSQVLEITSFAVLPNGSQKLLQYLVARSSLDLSFPAAVTLDGPIGLFGSSDSSNFWMSGIDQQHGGNCPPASAEGPKPAIGTIDLTSVSDVRNGIPPYSSSPNLYHYDHYVSNSPQPTNPGIGDISGSLIPAFQTVSSLDNVSPPGLVQTLSAAGVADHVLSGPLNSLPDYGTATRMVTTVVNGDLTLSGNLSGYGLLVVTGDLAMGGNVSWNGVILVIGQGHMFLSSTGFGEVDGAILIARTRHNDYSLQTSLHPVTFDIPSSSDYNHGYWYNSCWVKAALPLVNYKILSFHEISQ